MLLFHKPLMGNNVGMFVDKMLKKKRMPLSLAIVNNCAGSLKTHFFNSSDS